MSDGVKLLTACVASLAALGVCVAGLRECSHAAGAPDTSEYRCDDRAIERWTLECVRGARSAAGESSGIAADCLETAARLFCETVRNGRASRPWVWRERRWQLE